MRFGLIFGIIFAIVSFIPHQAFAAVVVTQFNSATQSSSSSGINQTQYIGTGISGVFTSLSVKLKYSGSSALVGWWVIQCDTLAQAQIANVNNGTCTLAAYNQDFQSITSTGAVYTWRTDISQGGTQLGLPFRFDPTKYYTILIASGQPFFSFGSNASSSISSLDPYGFRNGADSVKQLYIAVTTDGTVATSTDPNSNYFSTFTPARGSTIATSSSALVVGASGNISYNDWISGADLQIRWRQITGMNLRGNDSTQRQGYAIIPLTIPGVFNVSTSSSALLASLAIPSSSGIYEATAIIEIPYQTFFGINIPFTTKYLAQDAWQFTVASSSPDEVSQANVMFSTTGAFAAASTTGQDASCHASLDFSITNCLSMLFIPNAAALQSVFNQFHDTFLAKVPIGYVTRFVTILTGNVSPVEPPAIINYKFGTSSPQILQNITANDPIYFQPFDHLDVLNSVRSDQGDNKSIWDIVDPVIQLFVSLSVATVIIGDLIGLDFTFGSSSDDGEWEGGQRVIKNEQYYMKRESRRSSGMERNDIQY